MSQNANDMRGIGAAGLFIRRVVDSLRVRLGRMSRAQQVRWYGARSIADGQYALIAWGRAALRGAAAKQLLIVGADDGFRRGLLATLQAAKLPVGAIDLAGLAAVDASVVAAVLCAAIDEAGQQRIAAAVQGHPGLAHCRFEYVGGLDPAQAQFAQQDEYADTFFVSPSLRDAPGPYAIYQESLQLFEQKCGLRDYLDLYQAIRDLVRRDVPGDIAEFGSYKGHSGWLIARTLQALGSNKRLWMFDMFESFPEETLGVDQFWSNTHTVDFAQVSAKLAGFANVTLVRGDFTRTLAESAVRELALAYVDCDSYRATHYLLTTIPDRYLQTGGKLICEDYGHPALLGNRVAVHATMDQRKDFSSYFSQFSGLYIFTKLSGPSVGDATIIGRPNEQAD